MPDRDSKEDQHEHFETLSNAVCRFIESAHMIPIEGIGLESDTATHHIIGSSRHYMNEDTDETFKLVVDRNEWFGLLELIYNIFGEHLSEQYTNQTVNFAVSEFDSYLFDENQIQTTARSITRRMILQATSEMFAYMPIFGLSMEGTVEATYGPATLFSGGPKSDMTLLIEKDQYGFLASQINTERPFMRIPVTGDAQHMRKQVESLVQDAFAIFRFARGWKSVSLSSGDVKYASYMPIRLSEDFRIILYQRCDQPDSAPGSSTGRKLAPYSNEHVQQARYFGLDDINFHYNNQDSEVSQLITRAVQMYDSALTAPYEWMQMYRYVASVDIALIASDTKNYRKAQEKFETLIENSDGYIIQTHDQDTSKISVEDFYQLRSSQIKTYYTLRGQIIHGNLIEKYENNYGEKELNIMRELAHNTIRLMARCARSFGWKTKDEFESWFDNPTHITDSRNFGDLY